MTAAGVRLSPRELHVEQARVPMPDEDRMAGYDAPSEGRAMREQQDADAEGPQAGPDGEA